MARYCGGNAGCEVGCKVGSDGAEYQSRDQLHRIGSTCNSNSSESSAVKSEIRAYEQRTWLGVGGV
jgi:hypothetical protein